MVEIRFKPADVGTVEDGGVTTAKLADGAVTTPKVADVAITEPKIGVEAVTDAKVKAGVVVDKITGAVKGRAIDTTGDKGVTAIGWDSLTEEVIVDHEA